ncbi:hypothetical protein [Flexivirga sp. B27]
MDDIHEPRQDESPVRDDDLQIVVTRAAQVWDRAVVNDWLWGANSYLDGARPIDVLYLRGPAEVLEALDVAESGGFA